MPDHFSFIIGDLNYGKVNLKTSFLTEEISSLKNLKGKTNNEIDDFMKEFSNLAIGGIKRIFESDGPLRKYQFAFNYEGERFCFYRPQ